MLIVMGLQPTIIVAVYKYVGYSMINVLVNGL